MSPLAAWLRASLMLVVPLWVVPAFAGTRFDLSPYLGNLRARGDFKVYSFKGGERRVTVREVSPWKKGWAELIESTVAGTLESNGTAFFEDFLIPGKQLLSGSEWFDNRLTFFSRKPAKALKLLVDPTKPQRWKKSALLLEECGVRPGTCQERIGTAQRQGLWLLAGVEDVSTPSGDYPGALRAQAFSSLKLKVGSEEVLYTWQETLWYAEVRGLVRADVYLELHLNGELERTDDWTEELLSGSLGGDPFP